VKITRKQIRKLLLKEAKLLRENSASEILIDIEAAISDIVANTKGMPASHDYVMNQLMIRFPDFVAYLGGPSEFERFIYDNQFAMESVDFRTTKSGKKIFRSYEY